MMNKFLNNFNRVSKLFQPVKQIPKGGSAKYDDVAKSYRLMLDMGIIRQSNTGIYTLLPLGYRALEKLISIVDNEMFKIGAQKMLLPHLTNQKLWEKSGRLKAMGPELLTLRDRHDCGYILSPTYEEAIASMLGTIGPIQKVQLPLLLYQISNKWRDELKPRLGLFRSREFIMKDLYSFDLNADNAQNTYKLVHEAYKNIFDHIGLPYTIAQGDTGVMGGTLSHEFHYLSEIGEDTVLSCKTCGIYKNSTLDNDLTCSNCHQDLMKNSAIEVGHTFQLGTKYSKVFAAECHFNDDFIPLTMSCYGLGLTRILAASIEILSTDTSIKWPKCISPYTVCIIPPKENSKESGASHFMEKIMQILYERNIDFLIDDRTQFSIGKRMLTARRTGYPYIIVIGKLSIEANPLFEIHDINNSQQMNMSIDQLSDFFNNADENERTKATA